MFRKILSVSGFTFLSRLTGFARDILLAAILGAGMLADAFVVAMKLPNHFRAIFGEGAFSAAYVPVYTKARETRGAEAAQDFAARIFTLLFGSQIFLLILALAAMPWIIALLAPGFTADKTKYDLAITLSRITFPYLLFVTLVTQLSGSLNSVGRFAAAAFAPVLLNLTMIAALLMAHFFPSAAHAAAWAVTVAGIAELLLLVMAARRAGVMTGFARPNWDDDMRVFWKAFLPGVVGSSGVQLAMFADLILASLATQGGPATIYYADRLYQLPIGVIAIAAGTVLLPEMSRLISQGDEAAAHRAQSRALAFTFILAAPAFAAFLSIPDLAIRAMFQRGAFSATDAYLAALVLGAYGLGLPAIVMIRGAVASFHARSDTRTPMVISFVAITLNIAAKIVLAPRLGLPGLALATALGAWINLMLLVIVAHRRKLIHLDENFYAAMALASLAAAAMAWTMLLAQPPALDYLAGVTRFRDEAGLALVGGLGLAVYALTVIIGARVIGLSLSRL